MNGLKINQYEFNDNGKINLSTVDKGKDWPVVYLIHNDEELYVGETQNIYKRVEQHLKNKDRQNLKLIKIIFDDEFNKSAALDIEQSLIQLFNADNKYKLQNLNGGQSEKHNYYQREKYLNKLDSIWDILTKNGMTNMTLDAVRNTDLFKYSPYNTLTNEQNEACKIILYDIMRKLSTNTEGTSIIKGSAGTGKTIVLINMIYKLINANKFEIDFSDDDSLTDNNQFIHDYKIFYDNFKKEHHRELKIGYVVPMTSIRKTLKTVFSKTKNGLKSSLVIGPFDVFKDEYDILFIDEGHRLCKYKNISYRGAYRKCAEKMGKNPNEVTELDMIMANSKYRVIVYDESQTVKGSDITHVEFLKSFEAYNEPMWVGLTTQMRCKGGTDYIDYLSNIFKCIQDKKLDMINYEFKIFNDVDVMINKIKELDKIYGLCRNAAGYSWEWISKNCKSYEEAIANGLEDIKIGDYKYVWNMTNQEFIMSNNSINEIGCIHTLQGYDLNYVGVILGEEIDYNPITNKIEVDLNKFYDKYVKQNTDEKLVREYIINSYKVIMSRGIKGCFLYACNKNMRDYLARFVEKGE